MTGGSSFTASSRDFRAPRQGSETSRERMGVADQPVASMDM